MFDFSPCVFFMFDTLFLSISLSLSLVDACDILSKESSDIVFDSEICLAMSCADLHPCISGCFCCRGDQRLVAVARSSWKISSGKITTLPDDSGGGALGRVDGSVS